MNTIFVRLGMCVLAVCGFLFAITPAYAATPRVQSVKITGPNTVTIVYSEAVRTVPNDYGSFTGAFGDASLASVSGSGTGVIVLTLNNVNMASNATGGLTILNTVAAISDNSPIGGGQYSAVDGQAPLLGSFSMTSNLVGGTVARTGDTITVSFTANESVSGVSATIDGHTVTANGYGSGPYSASYTIASSDTQDAVPVTVSFTDASGNHGTGSFMLGGGLGPRITSITSDANTTGTLGSGGTINFVATLASPAPGAYVSGSYDGVPLSWTTNNGGATYTATFTVQQTVASTNAPLQISGVTVRDVSGNVSIAASGTDVQKTINSQSFSISQLMPVPSPVPSGTSARFGFFSPQEGIVTYGGLCTSPNQSASIGNNYVAFSVLPDGAYGTCSITVTDAAGYQSNALLVPAFTVGGGVAASSPVAAVTPAPAPKPVAAVTTKTSSAYVFTAALVVGSVGADVTALQKRLTADGLYTGAITGKYGALTAVAVKKFQKLHHLTQLGTVGPGTRAVLNSML